MFTTPMIVYSKSEEVNHLTMYFSQSSSMCSHFDALLGNTMLCCRKYFLLSDIGDVSFSGLIIIFSSSSVVLVVQTKLIVLQRFSLHRSCLLRHN